MTDDEIRSRIQTAVERVTREEPCLNFRNAHERATAHRLALHMEELFGPQWNVDCEYDRDGSMKKVLTGIAGCGKQRSTDAIFPDIIVHHRERQGRTHNLLVVELKKDASSDRCDARKLELMTNPNDHYQYQLGLYINIDGGAFDCTWYKDGQRL